MAWYANQSWTKRELQKRVGDISQIAGIRLSRLVSGRQDGVLCADINTGSGFRFSVLPDRGMDIAWAEYNGQALAFISKTGIVDARYYEEAADGFHRSFYAGLLTTCGLRNVGISSQTKEEYFGLHGRIANIPAQDLSVTQQWQDDEYIMEIRGTMVESKLYGENMTLTRSIQCTLGKPSLKITDVAENRGFRPEALTLLYHWNFGFPLLDPHSYLSLPKHKIQARDPISEKYVAGADQVDQPCYPYPEVVFYRHDLTGNEDGQVEVNLVNPKWGEKGIKVRLRYDGQKLPYLVEWKNMECGDYVLALEPANALPNGRDELEKSGNIKWLEPGESQSFSLQLDIVEKSLY